MENDSKFLTVMYKETWGLGGLWRHQAFISNADQRQKWVGKRRVFTHLQKRPLLSSEILSVIHGLCWGHGICNRAGYQSVCVHLCLWLWKVITVYISNQLPIIDLLTTEKSSLKIITTLDQNMKELLKVCIIIKHILYIYGGFISFSGFLRVFLNAISANRQSINNHHSSKS